MSTQRILTKAQAEAVYSAMCALNNVGGRVHVRLPLGEFSNIHVSEWEDGLVAVFKGDMVGNPHGAVEEYANQGAFREAYGLE